MTSIRMTEAGIIISGMNGSITTTARMTRFQMMKLVRNNLIRTFAALACVATLSACATTTTTEEPVYGVSVDALVPSLGGDRSILETTSGVERAHLQLISTNLISTLVQIPQIQPGAVTLQINAPKTAFGNAVVRALEDAGYGLQLVTADQGQNYVSYSKRVAETESGLVTDYEISAGPVGLRREYSVTGNMIFPTSLMTISGTRSLTDVELSDAIFAEQGGTNDAFISGVQIDGEPDPDLAVKTVDVRDYDEIPQDMRTPQKTVLNQARQHFFKMQAERKQPVLDGLEKYRRTVLIFDDNQTQMLGDANKQAVRTLLRGFRDDDILLIKACLDADGSNNADMTRAIRVEQEVLGYGINPDSSYIAPCARASYRHSSDNSAAPVELVQYRLTNQ